MTADWKDALAGLMASGNLPEADGDKTETKSADESRANDKTGGQTEALNIVFERKGRGGKSATIIEGFTLSDREVSDIASRLRHALGTGGSARGGEILLQGECRVKAAEHLRAMGFRVKGVK